MLKPRNPDTTGREETDATRMGPRCSKIRKVPEATVKAKKRVSRNEWETGRTWGHGYRGHFRDG